MPTQAAQWKLGSMSGYITPTQAAQQLGWEYHTFLAWVKRDQCGVLRKQLAIKIGWGWLVDKRVIELFREEKNNG